jgi:hypothetical protein
MDHMTALHLDLETYRKLTSGELAPARAREIAAHLDGDCSVCEEFLAALPPDGLDGAVDAALTELAPARPEEAGHDLEYMRIRRAIKAPRSTLSRVTRYVAIAAAFLVVGGAGLVTLQHRRASEDQWGNGEKGRPQVVPARLRFAVVEAQTGAPQLDHGRSGAVVPEGASLAFRVEVGRAAYVALLRVGTGESEVVWKQHLARGGAVDVSENGRPAAYPLHGLAGTQRFVLVASEHPIAAEDLGAAARAATGAGASREDPRWSVMTLDVVEVTVR